MKGDSSSVVTKKLNKLKDFVLTKKAKAIEATAGKFTTSNGSVNGLNHATSDAELQNKVGGETWATATSSSLLVKLQFRFSEKTRSELML